jgi:hypothetical protein
MPLKCNSYYLHKLSSFDENLSRTLLSVARAKGGLKEHPTHGPLVTAPPPPPVIYTAIVSILF